MYILKQNSIIKYTYFKIYLNMPVNFKSIVDDSHLNFRINKVEIVLNFVGLLVYSI